MNPFALEFHRQTAEYLNSAEVNDRVFAAYTAATAADPLLSAHRAHVERHQLGYGDPAFHALWQQLLAAAHERFGQINALEIGVFKGQVVSLWALLARHHGWPVRVHGITPFEGQPLPVGWWSKIALRFSPRVHERVTAGDFYPADDYAEVVRRHFAHHGLDFDAVHWIRGYSTAPDVLAATRDYQLQILYIDGAHTFEGACADIANFAPKVVSGGWLVMDDASYALPGSTFWKGYETVARACERLPSLGFRNVLNVGHNRVFEKS